MKKLECKAILTIVLMISVINGCKKTGPAGPAGNANVSSYTFSVSSWPFSSPYYYTNLSTPALTSANINSASVMAYFSATSGTWVALPFTQYNSPYNYVMNFNTSVGTTQVTWFYDTSFSNGSDPNAYYGTTIQIKVVVIPPSVRLKNPNVDYKNYDEVKKVFNLKG